MKNSFKILEPPLARFLGLSKIMKKILLVLVIAIPALLFPVLSIGAPAAVAPSEPAVTKNHVSEKLQLPSGAPAVGAQVQIRIFSSAERRLVH